MELARNAFMILVRSIYSVEQYGKTPSVHYAMQLGELKYFSTLWNVTPGKSMAMLQSQRTLCVNFDLELSSNEGDLWKLVSPRPPPEPEPNRDNWMSS